LQRIYGQTFPPHYRFDVVTAPIAVYSSKKDWLADPEVNIMQNLTFFSFFTNISFLK
jgi:hypothetical protein